jgi:hypothetical protein
LKESILPENFDLESFLTAHKALHGVRLAEKLKKEFGKYSAFLAEQIRLNPKAETKLPAFAGNLCLYTGKSLEQASSAQLAEFKARRFSGNRLLDLTGGLGADDAAFSKSFKKVLSIDNDSKLNEIARYNFNRLGVTNIVRIDEDAYEFIDKSLKVPKPGSRDQEHFYDLIYFDSDRRAMAGKKKSVTLHDSEPSVLKMKNDLFKICDCVLLKLSPLIDLTYLAKTLPETERIYVVSLDNEVKEILAVLNKSFSGIAGVTAVDISLGGIETEFSGKLNEQIEAGYSNSGKYFYEPAGVLIKSGLAAKYAAQSNVRLIAKNSLYMLGDYIIEDFFGRKFEVILKISFGKSNIRKYLLGNKITQANISKRNFPLSAVEIRKMFKLKDGGEDYLFFTQDSGDGKLMYHTRKCQ